MQGIAGRLRLLLGFGAVAALLWVGMTVVDQAEEIRSVLFSVQWSAGAPLDVWYIDSTGRHDVPLNRIAPTAKQLYYGGQWVNGSAYIKGARYELHATAPGSNPLTIEIHAGTHLAHDHANTDHKVLYAHMEAVW